MCVCPPPEPHPFALPLQSTHVEVEEISRWHSSRVALYYEQKLGYRIPVCMRTGAIVGVQ